MPIKATPERLDQLRRDRGWSMQQLSDAIYDRTRIRINGRTLSRFIERIGVPHDTTRHTLDKFFEDRKSTAHGASR